MEPVFPFELSIPTTGARTLAGRLHLQLRAAIVDGRLPPGYVLPSTRRVATALGLARNTVITAYDLLIAEGYIRSSPCTKSVVASLASASTAPSRPRLRSAGRANIQPAWRMHTQAQDQQPEPAQRGFRMGVPEHRYFPHDVWRRMMTQSLRNWSRSGFHHAPAEGIEALRNAIAQHVAYTRAVACNGSDVVVTSGAQQAFDLLARMLVTSGHTRVAVENPGYPPLRAAFAAAGARLCPIPVDAEGLRVDLLPQDASVICVTPSHQAPTGVAMSRQRRQVLLDFAGKRNAVIIEDDYDGEFRFGSRPLDALKTLDHEDRVFYVGTFSKSLFPELRKGFVVSPDWARPALIAIKRCTDAHGDPVVQTTLATFIQQGHLARHVRRMQPIYAARRTALIDGLHRFLGEWLKPIESEAGLHLAARILQPRHSRRIIAEARNMAPGAQITADYSMEEDLIQPAIAFGYGVIDVSDIGIALKQLARALER